MDEMVRWFAVDAFIRGGLLLLLSPVLVVVVVIAWRAEANNDSYSPVPFLVCIFGSIGLFLSTGSGVSYVLDGVKACVSPNLVISQHGWDKPQTNCVIVKP